MASSSRCRGLIASGVMPSVPAAEPLRPAGEAALAGEEADRLVPSLGRRRHEGERRRGVTRGQPRHAGDHAAGHRARHVEGEQEPLARRLDVLERRVERSVERVDELRHRRPRAPAADAATRRVRAERRQERRSGEPAPCGCGHGRRAARPPSPCRPSRASARRRGSSSRGSGRAPSSACPRAAPPRPRARSGSRSGAPRAAGRTRGRAPPPAPGSPPPARARSPRRSAADRRSSRHATIHSNRRRCSSVTSSVGLPAPTRPAGWASRSRSRWVMPSRCRYLTAW